jgi:hypothetical protein
MDQALIHSNTNLTAFIAISWFSGSYPNKYLIFS